MTSVKIQDGGWWRFALSECLLSNLLMSNTSKLINVLCKRWYSQSTDVRLSVRLSPCLSVTLSGIVSKQTKLPSWFLHQRRARTF